MITTRRVCRVRLIWRILFLTRFRKAPFLSPMCLSLPNAQRIIKSSAIPMFLMLTISADLPSSLSRSDFFDLLGHYRRQVNIGSRAAFARCLGFDPKPTLDLFVALILGLELSVREFLDGKETKMELPNQQEYQLQRRRISARTLRLREAQQIELGQHIKRKRKRERLSLNAVARQSLVSA